MFATSLAIQAKLSTKVKTEFDVEAAWKNLKHAQKPDGSFGHSITFTGIVHFCSVPLDFVTYVEDTFYNPSPKV